MSARPLHLLELPLRWPPESFLQWKLEALVRRGMRVTVASPASVHDRGFSLPGVRVRRVPDWGEPRGALVAGVLASGLALLLRRPRRLPRVIRAVRGSLAPSAGAWDALALLRSYLPLARLAPDVAHIEWNSAAVHYLPLGEIWGCPLITSCHGGGVNVDPHLAENEHWVRRLPECFRRAAAVHCVSEATAREASRYGLEAEKVNLIRPAVDPDLFRPPHDGPPRGSAFHVVAVGGLRWDKGYEYALQAIRKLADRGVPVELEIVGGDPDRSLEESPEARRIRFTVEDLGLSERVVMRGQLPSGEIRPRLQASHALLHASVTEGIPTAVLEGMASELPVVVTDCGGVREAVTDGREGLVVPPRSPEAMAGALESLWRDSERAREMGRAGRRRVRSSFRLDDHIRSFETMYETTVAGWRESR